MSFSSLFQFVFQKYQSCSADKMIQKNIKLRKRETTDRSKKVKFYLTYKKCDIHQLTRHKSLNDHKSRKIKCGALTNSLSLLLLKWLVTVSETGYMEFKICTICILEIKRFCFRKGFFWKTWNKCFSTCNVFLFTFTF